jgi:cytochrome d ubiquinol oxidase subunit II
VSLADVTAAVLLLALTLYAVFGGADFGAGLWALLAGRGARAERARSLVEHAIGPVWEANHVWLIFALVIAWTAFGEAFASVMSTLFIPLSLAALGIVLRGCGFAFRKVAPGPRGRRLATAAFAGSSVLTPFFLGTAVGAVASGRVPTGNAAGDELTSWTGLTSIVIGVLFVCACAYLAAVFGTVDARRLGDDEMERYFAARAVLAAIVSGALAVAGIFVLRGDARYLYDGLTNEGLPLVIGSLVAGAAALALLLRGARRGTRQLAVVAVVAVVWGWGVAQHPYLLPGRLTIAEAAAGDPTLTALVIVFGAAAAVVGPALALLYVLDQRSILSESEPRSPR